MFHDIFTILTINGVTSSNVVTLAKLSDVRWISSG